jgi:3-methyladenine DNA glycosylase AlkC
MSQILSIPGKGCHCHKLIGETAKEMAAATYEFLAKQSDAWYAKNPSQDLWVKQAWPLYIEEARRTLASLLGTNISDDLKDQIHDAIIKDGSLRRGRVGKLQAAESLR